MFKVAALAVVKDEAAYIVDWINHCFYMGFEEVYIAVNRSSDLTEKILFDFSALDNRVHVYNTDWLDMFPNRDGINIHLQYYSFCFLLNEASKKEDITHFFPLDADEFWFSDVFGQSIGEYLSSLPSFDVVSIPWAAQSGDSMEFLMPFENSLFTLKQNVKSVFSRDALSNIEKYLLHIPDFNCSELKHLDSNGDDAVRIDDKTQRIKINSNTMRSMILHRMLRSQKEYVALLMRQRPSSTLPIKDNRSGFDFSYSEVFDLGDSKSQYFDFLEKGRLPFIEDIEFSKDSLVAKADSIFDVDFKVIKENIDVYLRVLRGTDYFDRLVDLYCESCDSFSDFRDLAIRLENKDLDLSYHFMKCARNLRPNGTLILKKIASYEEALGI